MQLQMCASGNNKSRAAPQEWTSQNRGWLHLGLSLPTGPSPTWTEHSRQSQVPVMGSVNRHRQASDGPRPGAFHGIQLGATAERDRDQAEDKATARDQSPSRRQGQRQGCIQHTSKGSRRQPGYKTGPRSIHGEGPEAGLETPSHNKTQAATHLAPPCTLKVFS